MKSTKWNFYLLLGILVLTNIPFAFAQDWPQWRGLNRDGVVAGFKAPVWPAELTRQWSVKVGTGDATPTLVGDKLFTFTRQDTFEVTLCLNAINGQEIWRNEYEAQEATGAAARHPGPRSSPAVADGKIVTLGIGGVLSCLEVESGKLLWRKDPFPKVTPMFFTSMSPIIVDGICIAHLGGAGNGAIIAYNLKTGEEKWRWNEEGPEYSSPALMTVAGTKQIVTLSEKSIVSLAVADGKLLWKLPFAPERRAYNAATPIIEGSMVIYTGAGRGTKAVKIEKQGEVFSPTELWSNPDVAVQFNTPVLKNKMVFGYTNQGQLFCLDAGTGNTEWVDTIKHDRSGFAAILDAGPVMMALPSSSQLIVYKPVGKEYSQLDKIKVADTPIYAHPVISGNRIFIKDQENITLWTIK